MLILILNLALMTGCGMEEDEKEKVNDIEFTVVPEENIPKELKTLIDNKKKGEFIVSYGDKENLFIAVGYGEQPIGGYSIQVKELYETKNNIFIDTEFIGPSKSEDVSQTVSYPYIVVQMEYIDKQVRSDR
ncbi:MAG: protease complex subunit PrcB family protein [Lachnospiraceae bacterium]|nr:protease complex subunit PrcB family protein [Lachnospiraceae bacterium]